MLPFLKRLNGMSCVIYSPCFKHLDRQHPAQTRNYQALGRHANASSNHLAMSVPVGSALYHHPQFLPDTDACSCTQGSSCNLHLRITEFDMVFL